MIQYFELDSYVVFLHLHMLPVGSKFADAPVACQSCHSLRVYVLLPVTAMGQPEFPGVIDSSVLCKEHARVTHLREFPMKAHFDQQDAPIEMKSFQIHSFPLQRLDRRETVLYLYKEFIHWYKMVSSCWECPNNDT